MMRLLAWAAWACAEAAGVAFVERIVSAYAPNVAAIFAADANGDGRIEVWSAADGAYGLRSYEHNWRHDLPDEYDTYVLESGSAWVDVVAADFDGDGALEVAAATSADVSWNEYEYLQWVGYSTPIVESMYEDAIAAIFAADVDGDADVDVVAAHRGVGGPVSWYENLAGSGFASTSWASYSALGGSAVYAVDVDGDDDVDFAAAEGGSVFWLDNANGTADYVSRETVGAAAATVTSLAAVDVDGDGDVDVVVGDALGNVAWFENFPYNATANNATVVRYAFRGHLGGT